MLILDTETTGLFPRGGDKHPPQTPSAPILNPSTQRGATCIPRGGDKHPPQTPSAQILNPSAQIRGNNTNNNKSNTQRGFKGGSTPTLPYAVQISYAIIDTSSPVFPIVEDYDAIIRISDETPLPPESVAIHGITREIIRSKGVPIEHALSILQRSIDTYDVQLVVGHNVQFDLRVLETECARCSPSAQVKSKAPSPSSSPDPTSTPGEGASSAPLRPPPCPSAQIKNSPRPYSNTFADSLDKYKGGLRGLCPLCHLPSFCTARESVGVCNLRADSMYGGTYLKFGKLGQVFEILFKERDAARGVDMKVFEKYMHNSRVDVLMCARVYVWLCYSVDVFDAWYREMQNYADEDFINVDDSHLVGGRGQSPLRSAQTPRGAEGFKGRGQSPLRSAQTPIGSPSPRRSDRLRLKRMRDEGSILII